MSNVRNVANFNASADDNQGAGDAVDENGVVIKPEEGHERKLPSNTPTPEDTPEEEPTA